MAKKISKPKIEVVKSKKQEEDELRKKAIEEDKEWKKNNYKEDITEHDVTGSLVANNMKNIYGLNDNQTKKVQSDVSKSSKKAYESTYTNTYGGLKNNKGEITSYDYKRKEQQLNQLTSEYTSKKDKEKIQKDLSSEYQNKLYNATQQSISNNFSEEQLKQYQEQRDKKLTDLYGNFYFDTYGWSETDETTYSDDLYDLGRNKKYRNKLQKINRYSRNGEYNRSFISATKLIKEQTNLDIDTSYSFYKDIFNADKDAINKHSSIFGGYDSDGKEVKGKLDLLIEENNTKMSLLQEALDNGMDDEEMRNQYIDQISDLYDQNNLLSSYKALEKISYEKFANKYKNNVEEMSVIKDAWDIFQESANKSNTNPFSIDSLEGFGNIGTLMTRVSEGSIGYLTNTIGTPVSEFLGTYDTGADMVANGIVNQAASYLVSYLTGGTMEAFRVMDNANLIAHKISGGDYASREGRMDGKDITATQIIGALIDSAEAIVKDRYFTEKLREKYLRGNSPKADYNQFLNTLKTDVEGTATYGNILNIAKKLNTNNLGLDVAIAGLSEGLEEAIQTYTEAMMEGKSISDVLGVETTTEAVQSFIMAAIGSGLVTGASGALRYKNNVNTDADLFLKEYTGQMELKEIDGKQYLDIKDSNLEEILDKRTIKRDKKGNIIDGKIKKTSFTGYSLSVSDLASDAEILVNPKLLTKKNIREELSKNQPIIVNNVENNAKYKAGNAKNNENFIVITPNHSSTTAIKLKYPGAVVYEMDVNDVDFDTKVDNFLSLDNINWNSTFGFSFKEDYDMMEINAEGELNNLIDGINNDILKRKIEKSGETIEKANVEEVLGKLKIGVDNLSGYNLTEIKEDLISQVHTLLDNEKITNNQAQQIMGRIDKTFNKQTSNNMEAKGMVKNITNNLPINFKKDRNGRKYTANLNDSGEIIDIEKEGLPVKVYAKNIIDGKNGLGFNKPTIKQVNAINKLLKLAGSDILIKQNTSFEDFKKMILSTIDTKLAGNSRTLGQQLMSLAGYDGILLYENNNATLYTSENNSDTNGVERILRKNIEALKPIAKIEEDLENTNKMLFLNNLRLRKETGFVFNESTDEFAFANKDKQVTRFTIDDVKNDKVVFLDENDHKTTMPERFVRIQDNREKVYDVDKGEEFEITVPTTLTLGGNKLTVKLKTTGETILKNGKLNDDFVITNKKGTIVESFDDAELANRIGKNLSYSYDNPLTINKTVSETEYAIQNDNIENRYVIKNNKGESRTLEKSLHQEVTIQKADPTSSKNSYIETKDNKLNVIPETLYNRLKTEIANLLQSKDYKGIYKLIDSVKQNIQLPSNFEELFNDFKSKDFLNPVDQAQIFIEDVSEIDGKYSNREDFDKKYSKDSVINNLAKNKILKETKSELKNIIKNLLKTNKKEKELYDIKLKAGETEKNRAFEKSEKSKFTKRYIDERASNIIKLILNNKSSMFSTYGDEMTSFVNNLLTSYNDIKNNITDEELNNEAERLYYLYQNNKKHIGTEEEINSGYSILEMLIQSGGVKEANANMRALVGNKKQSQNTNDNFNSITLNNRGMKKLNYQSDNFYDSSRIINARENYNKIIKNYNIMGKIDFKTNPNTKKAVVDLVTEYYRNPNMLKQLGITNDDFNNLVKKILPKKIINIMEANKNVLPENRWLGPLNMFAAVDINKENKAIKDEMISFLKRYNIELDLDFSPKELNKLCCDLYNKLLFFDGHFEPDLLTAIYNNESEDIRSDYSYKNGKSTLSYNPKEASSTTLAHEMGHLLDSMLLKQVIGTDKLNNIDTTTMLNQGSFLTLLNLDNETKNKDLLYNKKLSIVEKLSKLEQNIQNSYDTDAVKKSKKEVKKLNNERLVLENQISKLNEKKKLTKKEQSILEELKNQYNNKISKIEDYSYMYSSPNETFARFVEDFYYNINKIYDADYTSESIDEMRNSIKLSFKNSQYKSLVNIFEEINELNNQRERLTTKEETVDTSPIHNQDVVNYAKENDYTSISYTNKQDTTTVRTINKDDSIFLKSTYYNKKENQDRLGKEYTKENENLKVTKREMSKDINNKQVVNKIKKAGYKTITYLDDDGERVYKSVDGTNSTMIENIITPNDIVYEEIPLDGKDVSNGSVIGNTELHSKEDFDNLTAKAWNTLLKQGRGEVVQEDRSDFDRIMTVFKTYFVNQYAEIEHQAYNHMNDAVSGHIYKNGTDVIEGLFQVTTGSVNLTSTNLEFKQTDYKGNYIDDSIGLYKIKKENLSSPEEEKQFNKWYRLNQVLEILNRDIPLKEDELEEEKKYKPYKIRFDGQELTAEQLETQIKELGNKKFDRIHKQILNYIINQNKVLDDSGTLDKNTAKNLGNYETYRGYEYYIPMTSNKMGIQDFYSQGSDYSYSSTTNTVRAITDQILDYEYLDDVFTSLEKREYTIRKTVAKNELIKTMALSHLYDYNSTNEKERGTIEYYVEGKLQQFHTTKNISQCFETSALENTLNSMFNTPVGKFIKGSKELANYLWTGNNPKTPIGKVFQPVFQAGFQLRNFIKDFQEGNFNSKQIGLSYLKNYGRAVMAVEKKNKYFRMAVEAGLIRDMDVAALKGHIFNYLEQLPKLSEFIYYVDKGVKPTIAASKAQSINLNFDISGKAIKPIGRYATLYTNASIQGIDRFIKTNKEGFKSFPDFLKLVLKYGEALTPELLTAMANGFIFGDDDDEDEKEARLSYNKLSRYTKRNNYLFYLGNDTWLNIPKGRYQQLMYSIGQIKNIGKEGYNPWDFGSELLSSIKDNMSVSTETLPFASIMKDLIENNNSLTNTQIYKPHYQDEYGHPISETNALDEEGNLRYGITENTYYDTDEQIASNTISFVLAQLGAPFKQLSKLVDDDKTTYPTPLGFISQSFLKDTKYTIDFEQRNKITSRYTTLKNKQGQGNIDDDCKYKAVSLLLNSYYEDMSDYYNNKSEAITPDDELKADYYVQDMYNIGERILNEDFSYTYKIIPRTSKYNGELKTTYNGIAIFDDGEYYYNASTGYFTKLDTEAKRKKYKSYLRDFYR